MKKVVFVDLDGTISDPAHRLHFIQQEKTDWDAFYVACDKDAPNAGVIAWMRALVESGEYFVWIVSARRNSEITKTLKWLREHNVPYHILTMPRGFKDYRPDTVLKQEFLDLLVECRFEIAFVIDDRPTVIEMWRRNGLRVFPVHQERWNSEMGVVK